jgi:outer membrane lipoprotein-sorting protein
MADNINKAEEWFNSLTTYQAKFKQVSSDGSYTTGQFSLQRPYLSRFDYDDPVPLTLITTKTWLHVDEEDRRQVTSYPVSETPLALILADPVRLRDAEIETKSEIRDSVVVVTLEQHSGEAAGKVVLEFSQDPFELRRWIITDVNGITTTIFLDEPQKGVTLSPRLFTPTSYPAQSLN